MKRNLKIAIFLHLLTLTLCTNEIVANSNDGIDIFWSFEEGPADFICLYNCDDEGFVDCRVKRFVEESKYVRYERSEVPFTDVECIRVCLHKFKVESPQLELEERICCDIDGRVYYKASFVRLVVTFSLLFVLWAGLLYSVKKRLFVLAFKIVRIALPQSLLKQAMGAPSSMRILGKQVKLVFGEEHPYYLSVKEKQKDSTDVVYLTKFPDSVYSVSMQLYLLGGRFKLVFKDLQFTLFKEAGVTKLEMEGDGDGEIALYAESVFSHPKKEMKTLMSEISSLIQRCIVELLQKKKISFSIEKKVVFVDLSALVQVLKFQKDSLAEKLKGEATVAVIKSYLEAINESYGTGDITLATESDISVETTKLISGFNEKANSSEGNTGTSTFDNAIPFPLLNDARWLRDWVSFHAVDSENKAERMIQETGSHSAQMSGLDLFLHVLLTTEFLQQLAPILAEGVAPCLFNPKLADPIRRALNALLGRRVIAGLRYNIKAKVEMRQSRQPYGVFGDYLSLNKYGTSFNCHDCQSTMCYDCAAKCILSKHTVSANHCQEAKCFYRSCKRRKEALSLKIPSSAITSPSGYSEYLILVTLDITTFNLTFARESTMQSTSFKNKKLSFPLMFVVHLDRLRNMRENLLGFHPASNLWKTNIQRLDNILPNTTDNTYFDISSALSCIFNENISYSFESASWNDIWNFNHAASLVLPLSDQLKALPFSSQLADRISKALGKLETPIIMVGSGKHGSAVMTNLRYVNAMIWDY